MNVFISEGQRKEKNDRYSVREIEIHRERERASKIDVFFRMQNK